jgi:hypothetical protein
MGQGSEYLPSWAALAGEARGQQPQPHSAGPPAARARVNVDPLSFQAMTPGSPSSVSLLEGPTSLLSLPPLA